MTGAVFWLSEDEAADPRLLDGSEAVVLAATATDAADRVFRHGRLVAALLGRETGEVALGYAATGLPVVVRPAGTPLFVSRASRGPSALLAVSRRPVGVDLELVDPSAKPPLAVLHPDERTDLDALDGEARARRFAVVWAVKEAYLKLQGTGLTRDPASFAVRWKPDGTPGIYDPDYAGDLVVILRPMGRHMAAVVLG